MMGLSYLKNILKHNISDTKKMVLMLWTGSNLGNVKRVGLY